MLSFHSLLVFTPVLADALHLSSNDSESLQFFRIFLSILANLNRAVVSGERISNSSKVYGIVPDIGVMVRVFSNGPGDLGSIPGRVIPKTLKMVLDASLLNTQHYKVRIKGKMEKSWERSSVLPYTLV